VTARGPRRCEARRADRRDYGLPRRREMPARAAGAEGRPTNLRLNDRPPDFLRTPRRGVS
jgi:hypothetical protein